MAKIQYGVKPDIFEITHRLRDRHRLHETVPRETGSSRDRFLARPVPRETGQREFKNRKKKERLCQSRDWHR